MTELNAIAGQPLCKCKEVGESVITNELECNLLKKKIIFTDSTCEIYLNERPSSSRNTTDKKKQTFNTAEFFKLPWVLCCA